MNTITELDIWRILKEHNWPSKENVHVRLETGVTPLLFALQRDLPFFVIEKLIEMGSDIFAKDNAGISVFQQTLHRKDNKTISILKLLLKYGVNLLEEADWILFEKPFQISENQVFQNTQRFGLALSRIPVLALLLLEKSIEDNDKYPLDLNMRGPLGETFLLKALKSERVPLELGLLLIEKTPSTQYALHTLLSNSLAWNKEEKIILIQKILEKGAFVDEKDKFGLTPLRICIKRRDLIQENTLLTLELLLKAGANPNEKIFSSSPKNILKPMLKKDLLEY